MTDFLIHYFVIRTDSKRRKHRIFIAMLSAFLVLGVFAFSAAADLLPVSVNPDRQVGRQLRSRSLLPRHKCGGEGISVAPRTRRLFRWNILWARHETFAIAWPQCCASWIHVAWVGIHEREIERDIPASYVAYRYTLCKIRHLCPTRYAPGCLFQNALRRGFTNLGS